MKLKACVGWVSMVLKWRFFQKWCFFQFHYRKLSYGYKNPTLNKVTKKKQKKKASQPAITFSKLNIETLKQRCEICSKLTIWCLYC